MKVKKYFIRCLDTDKTFIVEPDELLEYVTYTDIYPLRVVPIDCDGNLLHEYSFLVGDEYSLSFLFNDKNI